MPPRPKSSTPRTITTALPQLGGSAVTNTTSRMAQPTANTAIMRQSRTFFTVGRSRATSFGSSGGTLIDLPHPVGACARSTAAAGRAAALADVARAGRAHLGPAGHADRGVGLSTLALFHQLGGRVHVRWGSARAEVLRRSGLGLLRRAVTLRTRLPE